MDQGSAEQMTIDGIEDVPPVAAGWHTATVPCPLCGARVDLAMHVAGVLVMQGGEVPKLRLKATAKPVDHRCRT